MQQQVSGFSKCSNVGIVPKTPQEASKKRNTISNKPDPKSIQKMFEMGLKGSKLVHRGIQSNFGRISVEF